MKHRPIEYVALFAPVMQRTTPETFWDFMEHAPCGLIDTNQPGHSGLCQERNLRGQGRFTFWRDDGLAALFVPFTCGRWRGFVLIDCEDETRLWRLWAYDDKVLGDRRWLAYNPHRLRPLPYHNGYDPKANVLLP